MSNGCGRLAPNRAVFTDTFLDAQAWEMPMRRDDPSQRVDDDELASRIGRAGVDGGNECGTARSALRRAATLISDLTSGTETYAAGRYMDLDRNATGIYELDFNRAYHPYCYYNLTYECPIPPPENRLKVPIRAGERIKKRT